MIDLSSPLESNIISLTAKLCERRSVGAASFFSSVAEEGGGLVEVCVCVCGEEGE